MHGEAVELARETDREIGDIDHLLHFAQAFGEDLAHFERHQRAQVRLVRAQLIADLADDAAALWRGDHPPLVEGRGGACHHGFIIGRAGQ